eukprot:12224544-Ditylum_brightwellii.AAC.1
MDLGTAWTLQSLCSLGYLYGKVVYLDAIEGTNEEEQSLLALSTHTGLNKLVTILRAVLPNNQQW